MTGPHPRYIELIEYGKLRLCPKLQRQKREQRNKQAPGASWNKSTGNNGHDALRF
jgi:hypothetical protein